PAARIETIPKRGYRFVADVTALEGAGPETDAPPDVEEQPAATIAPAPTVPPGSWRRFVAASLAIGICAALAIFLLGFKIPSRPPAKPAPPPNSIAVLPFSNFTSDAQMDYLGDGLTDELIHELTRVPSLRVVG